MNSPKTPSTTKQDSRAPIREELVAPRIVAECWCDDSRFIAFGPDYLECQSCGTLVSQKGLSSAETQVVDDESDFYGKQYWLNHQQQDLDLPDFEVRTRSDLPERNLHWLRALLKYRLPPARVMELGCAHGSFVALMGQAGYVASGVEMSPWVVAYAQETFGIDVRTGPVEALDVTPGSLDAIAMMDVMEHLPDPVATMTHCLGLLKPDGILLIQMPNFQEGMRYEALVESNSSFLSQLKSDEHLYLYSKRSTTEFFHRLGADYIQFEPAIFAHYDMFFVVSKMPLHTNSQEQIEASLQLKPSGRVAQAMLDMKERYDQAPGLQAEMASHSEQLHELYKRADELANARNLALAQLADLKGHFEGAEKDRAARGEVIEVQGRTISELQAQVHQRLEELNALYPRLDESARALVDALHILTEREQHFTEREQHFTAREQHFQEEVARRDADMDALRRRRWWKLGKLIKAL
jgi:2-polyprenyl-3-methyl-5-hydroxy-6-metoxy-1,4-benzoquinol methylase